MTDSTHLFIALEAAGLPPASLEAPLPHWPRVLRVAWQVYHQEGVYQTQREALLRPAGFRLSKATAMLTGLSQAQLDATGEPPAAVMEELARACEQARWRIGYDLSQDTGLLQAEWQRAELPLGWLTDLPAISLAPVARHYLNLKGPQGQLKTPTLREAIRHLGGPHPPAPQSLSKRLELEAQLFFALREAGAIVEANYLI